MLRNITKSKIGIVLAVLFGISIFFMRGGKRYSNLFDSDNVVARVSGTPISTTKFNRTLQMNINQFNQILGKSMSREEIKAFQIDSLALGALINDAVFENEFDQKGFKLDETIIAQKTKEKIPQLYEGNRLNKPFLNQFLQQQNLKIEDIVQIIDFETRDQFFNEAFFNINYPINFTEKIYAHEHQKRKIRHTEMPLKFVSIEEIQTSVSNIDKVLEDFYNENLNEYMTDEKRNIEYIIVDKKKYISNFTPSDFEISKYYNNNKDLYLEREKRTFIQFNFKSSKKAENFKDKINSFKNDEEIIKYANDNNIKFNSFKNLSSDDVLKEIADVLFKLQINQQSEIIETTISKHIIILQNIKSELQLQLTDVQNDIKETITNIEVSSYLDELNSKISEKIVEGKSLNEIANLYDLELLTQNNLTKNFSKLEGDKKDFYKSLISNVFNSNKDFVNDIVTINPDSFYIFNVKDIVPSKPISLSEIKDNVLKDWQKTKRIEKILNESKNNLNFFDEISDLHNLTIKDADININSKELPIKLISDIFKADKGTVVQLFDENKVYIAIITDITIPKNINEVKELSLQNDLKGSFGTELVKNKEITTNDKLIDAVISNY
jgi:peptidyl-prolyl cis-trans isomerase D